MTIFRPSLVLCITLALPISACRSRTYNPGPSGSLSTKSTAGASKPQSVDGVLGIPVVQYLRKEKAPVTLWTSENVGEDIGGAEILETFADGRKEVLIQLKPPSGLQADVDVLPSGEPFLPTPGALPDNADDWIQYEAPCNLISRFHGGYDVVKDAKLNCIVFSGGLAVDPIETVIPVGPKYAGFVSKGPARDALQPGAMRPLPTTSVASDKSFDIPPARPNESVDAATLLPVMLDMLKVLKPGQEMRVRPCLRNPLTNRWGDLALHFYCQIPKDMRTCYSTAVLTERRRLMTSDFKPMASATPAERNALAVKATLAAHGLAWKECFEEAPTGKTAEWFLDKAHPVRANAFRYAVWTIAGVRDFNIESENAVIDAFYAAGKIERFRRALDSYPRRAPDQPRYETLRATQKAVLDAASASAP